MGKVVLPKSAVSVLGLTPSATMTAVRPVRPVDSPEPTEDQDLRLIIEEAGAGGLVYTIVDRRTGKVVRRLSREEVLRLKEKAGYAAGAIFSGKV